MLYHYPWSSWIAETCFGERWERYILSVFLMEKGRIICIKNKTRDLWSSLQPSKQTHLMVIFSANSQVTFEMWPAWKLLASHLREIHSCPHSIPPKYLFCSHPWPYWSISFFGWAPLRALCTGCFLHTKLSVIVSWAKVGTENGNEWEKDVYLSSHHVIYAHGYGACGTYKDFFF